MSEDLKETPDIQKDGGRDDEKRPSKNWSRYEFALFINDFVVCKRTFPINGYVDGSMQTENFKDEVDKIVEIINDDLTAKSRVYTWYHNWPEYPDWEPEMFTEPLVDEGQFVLTFGVYENGREVVAKQWDARFYPSYVRKNVDLTNRIVKITKDEQTRVYDKESFFENFGGQLHGDLYVLKCMIADKENLVPIIQKCIYEVCSSFDGYYEKSSDYKSVLEFKNNVVKRDEDGKPIYVQKTHKDANGNEYKVYDAFGKPWMVPVLEQVQEKPKRYNLNIESENRRLYSAWGAAVSEKTRNYMRSLYVSPRERFFKKKGEE